MLQAIMHPDAVYRYPLWMVALSMVAGGLAAALITEAVMGPLMSARSRRRHAALTSATLSVVGLTFGVLLAFVAMLAWDSYSAARLATSREAAQLLDLHRVADSLDEPDRTALRSVLVDYAEVVRGAEWPAQAEGRPAEAALAPLDRADAVVAKLQPRGIGQGNVQAALLAGLTRLHDARDERILAARTTIPTIIWAVVVAGGAITLAFAAMLGRSSRAAHVAMTSLLSLSGVIVLVMIVALSNPFRGDLRITAQPFEAVRAQMGG